MNEHLNDLKEIRQMMEKSSKFLSISGLSGVAMGIVALLAASVYYYFLNEDNRDLNQTLSPQIGNILNYKSYLVWALITMISSIAVAWLFTVQKSKKQLSSSWTKASKLMFFYMAVILGTGGLIILILLSRNIFWPTAGLTLIFYGLSLVVSSNFTFSDIRVLGFIDLILGFLALIIPEYNLILWSFGFGFMHIIYGLMMYFKYDK